MAASWARGGARSVTTSPRSSVMGRLPNRWVRIFSHTSTVAGSGGPSAASVGQRPDQADEHGQRKLQQCRFHRLIRWYGLLTGRPGNPVIALRCAAR